MHGPHSLLDFDSVRYLDQIAKLFMFYVHNALKIKFDILDKFCLVLVITHIT